MKLNVRIAFDVEDQEYIVCVDGISEIFGTGITESLALLNFLTQFEAISSDKLIINSIINRLEYI